MRNPAKRRNITLAVAAVGASTLVATILQNRGRSPVDGRWFAVVIVSFFVTLFAMVAVAVYQVHTRWRERLRRGHKRLAQWALTPAEWEQFRINDKTWRKSGRTNSLKLRKELATSDVEVIIAQDALMVDDDFYSLGALRDLQWIPESPPSLEYNMVTMAKNGAVRWNIRLPVAASAEAQARAVWDYVHRPVPDNTARTIRRFRFARTLGLMVAAISVAALVFARMSHGTQEMRSSMLWALVCGSVGLPAGLISSAILHWQLRRVEHGSKPVSS